MDKLFHVTIGAFPSTSLRVEQELRMLRVGLLYADRVTLYSPQATAFLMTSRVAKIPIQQQIRLLEDVMVYLFPEEQVISASGLFRRYRTLNKKHKSRAEILEQRQIEMGFQKGWIETQAAINRMVDESGVAEINDAIKSGLVELHTFEGTETDDAAINFIVESVARASKSPKLQLRLAEFTTRQEKFLGEFVDGISRAVSDGFTYPLFDDQTNSFIRAVIGGDALQVSTPSVERSKHVALASQLLQRLPLFESASISEILDIRSALDKPLIRFRSGMMNFAEKIKTASWDKDFPTDAEQVFYRDVAPAVLEIEEAVQANNYFSSVLRSLVDKPLLIPSSSVIGLALSQLSSLPHEIAVSLGAGIPATTVILDAYKDWKEKNHAIEQNSMFFYYQVGKRLK